MKRVLLVCIFTLMLFTVGLALASAQRPGLAPESAPRSVECGLTAGPCPTATAPSSGGSGGQNSHSGDEDGDGIPDGIDQCPNDGGPSANQGCPAGRSLTAATEELVLMAQMPLIGPCVMATLTGERVNLHTTPSLSAPTVPFGWLDPSKLYTVDAEIRTSDGKLWYSHYYGVESSIAFGYALKSVVRTGGNCNRLPLIHWTDALSSYINPSSDEDTHIVPDGGSDQQSNGFCSPDFGIRVLNSNGLDQAIHFTFGAGSVQPNPAQGCLKLDPDGHGFGILPPDTNAQPFSLHFRVGYPSDNPKQLSLIAQLLPLSIPGEPPPDPDKVGFSLIWYLPPDPCKAGDPTCANTDGALHFGIDWSQAGAAHPGVALSWDGVPPGPCKPGDSSCANNSGKQGVLFGLLPAVQGGSDLQPTAYFFPNGFDPNVGGFTQIEHQPNGSDPGAQYGFTLIERGPQVPQVTVNFMPSAAQ